MQFENEHYDTIPMRTVVPFPGMTIRAELGKDIRPDDINLTNKENTLVFLAPVIDVDKLSMSFMDLYDIGVVARITNISSGPEGRNVVVFDCLYRAKIRSTYRFDNIFHCEVERCMEQADTSETNRAFLSKIYRLLMDFARYVSLEAVKMLDRFSEFEEAGAASDYVARTFFGSYNDCVSVLQETQPIKRAERCCAILEKGIAIYELESSIQAKVKYRLQKHQRDTFLREEMSVIRGELGMDEEVPQDADEDIHNYKTRIEHMNLPEEVVQKLRSEVQKLSKIPFGTAESTLISSYLDTCLELPWNVYSDDCLDLELAKQILDDDHEGIEKVKERIIEFLAVKKLNPKTKGQILCFVGPPGVGKTSVAKSIACATNRSFARISLGGIRDEAEIRGHRKTYIGAMPGRIIKAIKQAATVNPVILLDEIDKLTVDSHGDPASALLEVLDGEQNSSFRDHYLEMPFDLSSVLFIATANTLDTVPPALLDRLEVIEMNSYTDREKLLIAKNHLIPKELKNHGLKKTQCKFSDDALQLMIRGYTHENGVRNLERSIATVCRKTARKIVSGESKRVTVSENTVRKDLGPVKYLQEHIGSTDRIGIVNGLAWTSLGGELLQVEVSSVPGTGKLELTGNLGDVMKESAKTALSYVRKHYDEFGIDAEFYNKLDLHIHVPEGAVPKDGPSAGVTLCTALISELSGRTVKRSVAMTGEISLTGRVLAIGGLREKTMAAYKYGCDTVIIPSDNSGDIEEIDGEVKEHLKFLPVKNVSEVLQIALNS